MRIAGQVCQDSNTPKLPMMFLTNRTTPIYKLQLTKCSTTDQMQLYNNNKRRFEKEKNSGNN